MAGSAMNLLRVLSQAPETIGSAPESRTLVAARCDFDSFRACSARGRPFGAAPPLWWAESDLSGLQRQSVLPFCGFCVVLCLSAS